MIPGTAWWSPVPIDDPGLPDKYVVGPLLTLMAIAAGGEPYPWSDVNRMAVHVVYREHVLNLDYTVDPRRSADYLAGLVEDFFSPSPLEWLPFETLFADAGLRARIGQDRGGRCRPEGISAITG